VNFGGIFRSGLIEGWVQNLSPLWREASSRRDPSPDRAGGGAHAPSEDFAAALYPGLNPLSVPAGDVLIRAVVPIIAELGSGRGEAARGGDGFALRIHERESVAATEVMDALPRHERVGVPVLARGRSLVKTSCRIRSPSRHSISVL
jgi:hypothetical protein